MWGTGRIDRFASTVHTNFSPLCASLSSSESEESELHCEGQIAPQRNGCFVQTIRSVQVQLGSVAHPKIEATQSSIWVSGRSRAQKGEAKSAQNNTINHGDLSGPW